MEDVRQLPAERPKAEAIQISRLTKDQIELLKTTICRGATDDELKLFVHVCNRSGLDPFAHQVHAVKRWDSGLKRQVMAVQTGIDGYRLIAERTARYEGQTAPEWCGEDGAWKDVWTSDKPPAAARVGVKKLAPSGAVEILWGIALYREYVQRKEDGHPRATWKTLPTTMLAKCAEALALRKAFPQELSGIYVDEEMEQADETSQAAPKVAMPKSIAEKAARPPKPADDGAPEWVGLVRAVKEKTGTTAKGKKWHLFTVVGKDEQEFSTFDPDLGRSASEAAGMEVPIRIVYETTERGKKVVELMPATEPEEGGDAEAAD